MFLAYFVYLFLCLILVFLAKLQSKQKLYWSYPIYFSIILFSFVTGLRYNVGIDYSSYYYAYLFQGNDGMGWNTFEPLYVMINRALNAISAPPYCLFVFLSFIYIIIFYKSYEKERELLVFSVLFLFLSGQIFSMENIVRQSIAQMIVFYGLKYLIINRSLKFTICVLLASLFHYSAAICLLLIFLNYKLYFLDKRLYLFLIYIIVVLFRDNIYSLLIYLFDFIFDTIDSEILNLFTINRFSIFGDIYTLSTGTGFGIIINIIIVLFTIIYKDYMYSIYGNKYLITFRIFIFGNLLMSIAGLDMNLRRISGYFTITSLYLYPMIIHSVIYRYKKNPKYFNAFGICLVIYSIVLFIYKINQSESGCSPYQFIEKI